ncbi:hypothetical protein AMECASPLE_037346 [Ameca splendens]|uniref:Diphthamide biosynthesis protein 3 n=1 Tax=Ameca splendens TaxID=208324 RepID=A0ABV0ZHX1_9TELE
MSVFHDEVEIEDFEFEEETEAYYFPCPCGDRFCVTKIISQRAGLISSFTSVKLQEDLENGEEVATCPSCSLIVKVIYDKELFMSAEIVEAPSEPKMQEVQS